MLNKVDLESASNKLFCFSEERRLGISCDLSARQTFLMKWQALFSPNNAKTKIKMSALLLSARKGRTVRDVFVILVSASEYLSRLLTQ